MYICIIIVKKIGIEFLLIVINLKASQTFNLEATLLGKHFRRSGDSRWLSGPFFFFTAQRGWSKGEEISLSTWLYVPPGAIVKNNQDIPRSRQCLREHNSANVSR